ncbi:MAG: tetratricopeptide repeat protein, partial [Ignavibacteriales bacterium]
MRNYRRKVGALLVLALFIVNLAGCSLFQSEKTAIAGVDKKLELAVKYLAENKFKEAMLTYQEVIRIDSKNAAAYKGLGLTYVLQKKNTAAEKTLTDGLNALPDNEQLQLALAGFMLDQGKYGSAEAIYSELITKGGASVQAYQAYSDCLIQRGKMAEAIALLEIVAENNGQYGLKTLLAELYSENGQREEALETINQSLNMEPNQSNAYRLLAGLYEDKWMELLALGDRYIQQDQTLTGVLYRFIALYGMNRYDQLITEYEKLNPDIKEKAGIRLLAAEAYSQSDQQERAAESIQDLKLAEIKDAGMLAELASYYMGSGDKDNARKAALRGITMDSNVIENYVV